MKRNIMRFEHRGTGPPVAAMALVYGAKAMNTDNRISAAIICPSSVAAVMIEEQAQRAEYVQALLARLELLAKRLFATIRPARQDLPPAGSWA